MPSTRSYVIALGDVLPENRQIQRESCDDVILKVAMRRNIKDRETDLVIRDTLPFTDLAVGAARESWTVPAAGVVGAETLFVGAAIPQNNVVGFYGLALNSAPNTFTMVRFATGNAAAPAITRGLFHLEQLENRLEPSGYLSEIVYFEKTEFCRISLMAKAVSVLNTQNLPLLARTIEPIGTTITMPAV